MFVNLITTELHTQVGTMVSAKSKFFQIYYPWYYWEIHFLPLRVNLEQNSHSFDCLVSPMRKLNYKVTWIHCADTKIYCQAFTLRQIAPVATQLLRNSLFLYREGISINHQGQHIQTYNCETYQWMPVIHMGATSNLILLTQCAKSFLLWSNVCPQGFYTVLKIYCCTTPMTHPTLECLFFSPATTNYLMKVSKLITKMASKSTYFS